MTNIPAPRQAGVSALSADTYRAIWRWHFYAGLLAVPFMILLAVTGSLYLFRDEIDRTVFSGRTVVVQETAPQLLPSALIAKAQTVFPNAPVKSYRPPVSQTASARVTLTTDAGAAYVFLNPYTGAVLDSMLKTQEFNEVVRKLHSLEYFGAYANRVIEAMAGFAIILVVSGLYLWWPRRQTGGVMTIRGTPSRRVFWRDTHAVTGAIAGGFIAFLALSGLPWSSFWGGKLTELTVATGTGYPAALWDNVPTSGDHAEHSMQTVGWTMEASPMPISHHAMGSADAGMTGAAQGVPLGIDRIVEIAQARGMAPGYEVTLPADTKGVFTTAVFPDDLAKVRTIHIDQYTGEPLVDIGYADYGPVSKVTEFAINVHMGQEFGLPNQLLMLATCLAIILSSVAAVVMWLKRRPFGRLGVPPYPASRRVYGVLWGMALFFGVLFPLSGLLIVAMVVIDVLLIRRVPALKRAFA